MTTDKRSEIFGHQPGLFLLFFTEMWERFSYYGMRSLLVLFLVSQVIDGGWGWERDDALTLYGFYTGLVYLTPIIGGFIADRLLGYRWAVVLGAFLMTLGHASMALETTVAFYAGLTLLILGNGLFKPNISSMVGQLYAKHPEKKDGAYTIFYMGINAGAFLGMLLCGYAGEKIGWSYGFGLAGIFMFLGMVMFQLSGKLFAEIGLAPNPKTQRSNLPVEEVPDRVIRDRLFVIGVLSFFTIFFWMAFEQSGGSMTLFAREYTDRVLIGGYATAFFWVNTLLTLIPLMIVTYVLIRLIMATFDKIPASNIAIATSFVLIWIFALFMIYKEYNMKAFEVAFDLPSEAPTENHPDKGGESEAAIEAAASVVPSKFVATIRSDLPLKSDSTIYLIDREQKKRKGKLKIISEDLAKEIPDSFSATVQKELHNETEIPASWFGILNALFIITFAPLFSKVWASKYNPSAPVKFGMGLILVGIGFGVLSAGSWTIPKEAESASRSIWLLVFAYLFHTLGELCVSPVGLSYVSKLAPLRLVGMMFGIWFLATFVANFLAGITGSYIDPISERYGIGVFYLLFTIVPILAGLAIWGLNPMLKRMMHGID